MERALIGNIGRQSPGNTRFQQKRQNQRTTGKRQHRRQQKSVQETQEWSVGVSRNTERYHAAVHFKPSIRVRGGVQLSNSCNLRLSTRSGSMRRQTALYLPAEAPAGRHGQQSNSHAEGGADQRTSSATEGPSSSQTWRISHAAAGWLAHTMMADVRLSIATRLRGSEPQRQ